MLRNRSVALSQNPRMVYVVVTGIIPRQICNLISVVVIAIRLSYVAQIIFCAAGTNIGRAQLLRTCFRIRLHVVIRIVSVTYFNCVGRISGESSCVVPGMVHVSSFGISCLTLFEVSYHYRAHVGHCRR